MGGKLAAFVLVISALCVGPALGCAAVLGLDSGSERGDAVTTVDGGTVPAADQTAPPVDATSSSGCKADEHSCGNLCVKLSDPQFGCGDPKCNPCSLAHATASCNAGACSVSACAPGFDDCDKNAANGCEADLANPATCGTCTTKCGPPTPLCANQACASSCPAGQEDCNGACVDSQTNATHCGFPACLDCTAPNSTPACNAGTCGITCNAGWGNCNGFPTDGCEAPLNTNANCGTCGHACVAPSLHETSTCQPGPPAYCAPSCASGWYDCDGNLADGCECQGAGCCGGGSDGGDGGGGDGASCQPPGATCMTTASTCCGSCKSNLAAPTPLPTPPQPPPPPPGDGTCCATLGQFCNTPSVCCAPGAPCMSNQCAL